MEAQILHKATKDNLPPYEGNMFKTEQKEGKDY